MYTKKIDINARDIEGKTALYFILSHELTWISNDDRIKLFKLLVNSGADINITDKLVNYSPLHQATENGFLEIVQFLIENTDVNIEAVTREGFTLLKLAAYYGHLPIVQYLVEKGANIHTYSLTDKFTPLHWAASEGHLDIVKFLIENTDINIEAVTRDKRTPLQVAACNGHLPIVQYLVEKGEKIEIDNNNTIFMPSLNLTEISKDSTTQLRQTMSGFQNNIEGNSSPQPALEQPNIVERILKYFKPA